MRLNSMSNLFKVTGLLLCCLFFSTNDMQAQKKKKIKDVLTTQPTQKDVPPIIDRETFFGDPEITGAQLSPDGKYMTFIKPFNEVRNIWVKETNEPFEKAKPLTADDKPIPGYFWSRDGKYVLYVQDKDGNEDFHVWAVNPADKLAEGQKVPEARDITPVDSVRAYIYSVPESKPDVMYIGFNDRDRAYHDLYEVNIATGERKLIHENKEKINGWEFDLNDELRLATRTNESGGTEVLRIDEKGNFVKCYECNIEENCYPYRYHKNGKQVYMVTNKGDRNLSELILFNPETGEEEFVESDPEKQVDFGRAYFSDVTDELIGTRYYGDKPRTYITEPAMKADYELLQDKFPGVEVNFGSSTDDEQLFIVYANSDTDPGAAYLFDRKTKDITFQYRPRPDLPTEHLAPMKAVRYKSSDGMEIPAYLTIPKGYKAENLPAILLVHGGPWSRDSWGYNSFAQFWANRGYVVLQPNFRGSTGYGKEFLNAGNGEWGKKMQDDVTWGAKYLIEQGIADPDKVGIMGGSYGGYATLAGVTFTPDTYAAGVSIVGPSNLVTLLESIPPYWESIRVMFHNRMGDPNTEEGLAMLKERSPLNSADKIKVPLMVVQGANDPRVKKAESDQIVVAMRELGLPVQYLVAPDEGHGFRQPENNMAFISAAEKFLAEHLGGRAQDEVPENIAQKLKDITVDINTVELPKALTEEDKNATMAKPEFDLKPATFKYQMKIKIQGQELPMEVKRTIEEKDGKWLVSDKSFSMMGESSDVCVLEKGSLACVSREAVQGPAKVSVTYAPDHIKGNMNMQGKDTPIDQKLDAPVIADGAALDLYLVNLPIKEGYSTKYRIYDMRGQKVKNYEFKVVAKESIKVPAGSFDVFKAEIASLDGDAGERTMWISTKDHRCIVKQTATVPEMGGATIVSELAKIK